MRFRIAGDRPTADEFTLVFRDGEHSIGPEPQPSGYTSLLVNEVNLEIDDESRILFPWGYCPLFGAVRTSKCPEKSTRSILYACLDKEFPPGVSLRINPDERWPTAINTDVGWICLGSIECSESAKWVEFAPASVAVLEDGRLTALWLRPNTLPPGFPQE